MADITMISVRNADTTIRKGFVKAFHALFHTMLAQKRAGDAAVVTLDDGTAQSYRITDVKDIGDGLEIHVAVGAEP